MLNTNNGTTNNNAVIGGYPSLLSLQSLNSTTTMATTTTTAAAIINSDITNNDPHHSPMDRRDLVPIKLNALPGTFQARDNVANFIEWCRRIQIHECLLFETEDLVSRKNEKSFVLCLLEVARYGAKFGMLWFFFKNKIQPNNKLILFHLTSLCLCLFYFFFSLSPYIQYWLTHPSTFHD